MKMFTGYFANKVSPVNKASARQHALFHGEVHPIDVPRKIIKLRELYFKILENDRAALRKATDPSKWIVLNGEDKRNLLDIQERFFKNGQAEINPADSFSVATMQFEEGVNFYEYLKLWRQVKVYCHAVKTYLTNLKKELVETDLRYVAYDVYEKGSGGVLNAYFVDPIKEMRDVLKNLNDDASVELLLQVYASVMKIVEDGSDNNDAAVFYSNQARKMKVIKFAPLDNLHISPSVSI